MSAAVTPTPPAMTTRRAVQVVVPGRLTTGMRSVEGVRAALEAGAEKLGIKNHERLYLAAVETTPGVDEVVYTFGVR